LANAAGETTRLSLNKLVIITTDLNRSKGRSL